MSVWDGMIRDLEEIKGPIWRRIFIPLQGVITGA